MLICLETSDAALVICVLTQHESMKAQAAAWLPQVVTGHWHQMLCNLDTLEK